ncbi:hypothetical protein AZ34_11945 [Hylemonella gracilis str. Niagara R]|uniref:Uncharacterized protein n=1 Tax=Hylemonella gracilis str. Niagara R TaxID=1458275 RepID=A0A016XLB7_9BURK|nr:hypothetical protein [Hylemonella gracilis]EYC52894.1 hypothetical protein AZ34_11945 [Hylemonella gracilis str. Niagara R]
MRPRSDARQALLADIRSHGHARLVDVVERTGLEYGKARQLLADSVRAGDLTYTLQRAAHALRPVAVYEPAVELEEMAGDCSAAALELAACWR